MPNGNVYDHDKAVDLSDYVAAMRKSHFTQNWDLAVTFDHRKINDILTERIQKDNHGLLKEFRWSMEMEDPLGERYTQGYQFTLDSPRIQFESTPDAPSCSLKVDITKGKVWTAFENGKIKKEEELVPNVHTIVIYDIGLNTVTREIQESIDDNVLKASGRNDVVVFPTEGGYSSYIVIDLNSRFTITLDCPVDVEAPCALKQNPLFAALRNFFINEIKPIHYNLATVNNARPSDGTTTDLVPGSFHFATMRVSNSQSYLTIFIHTRASERIPYNQPLQSLWIDEWTKAGVPPIPRDSSVSIIIKDSFFVTSFMSPALARYKATCTIEKTPDTEDGIRLKGSWPNVTRPEVPWETHVRLIALEETKRFRVHSMKYDPNVGGSPLEITLAQSSGPGEPAVMSVEWSYSFNNPWNGIISRTERDPPVVGVPVRNILELNGTFTSTYSLSLKKDLVPLDDASFHIEAKKSDWTVETSKTKNTDIRDILLPVPGELVDQKKLLEFAKDAAIDTFDIGVDFAKLKWFACTNVLLMGKKIQVDVQSGVRAPRDVIVVGDVTI